MAGPYSPLRSLGQRQLQIQFTLASTYDTQALGLMGLNGALVAAAIAAKEILEHLWWISLFGLLLSTAFCVVALSGTEAEAGPSIPNIIDDASAYTEDEIDELLARNIAASWQANAGNLVAKRSLIAGAIITLGITLLVAAFLAAVVS